MHNCIATFIIKHANARLRCLLEIHLHLLNAKKELKDQKSAIYLGELHNQCFFCCYHICRRQTSKNNCIKYKVVYLLHEMCFLKCCCFRKTREITINVLSLYCVYLKSCGIL